MKAILCKDYGPAENLVIEDIASPDVKGSGVKIRVKAAGLNFPDTLIIQGKYQFQPPMPFSPPGGELSGEVLEVGEKVTRFQPGDRVAALTGWGGAFAEEVVAPESNLLPIPDSMSDEKAAAFMMVYGTSYYALKQRGNLQSGETLLVLGASGGVGLAAVELGKAMGAKVIAAASSAEKLAVAKEAGADELVNYTEESLKDAVKKLTKGKGVDVIYDPVGGDFTEQALRTMGWNGRHLVIGFAAGISPQDSREPDAAQGLFCGRCILGGEFHPARAADQRPEHDGAVADVCRRQDRSQGQRGFPVRGICGGAWGGTHGGASGHWQDRFAG